MRSNWQRLAIRRRRGSCRSISYRKQPTWIIRLAVFSRAQAPRRLRELEFNSPLDLRKWAGHGHGEKMKMKSKSKSIMHIWIAGVVLGGIFASYASAQNDST